MLGQVIKMGAKGNNNNNGQLLLLFKIILI